MYELRGLKNRCVLWRSRGSTLLKGEGAVCWVFDGAMLMTAGCSVLDDIDY